MEKWSALFQKFSYVEKAFAWVGGVCIFFTAIYVTLDVLARLILKTSIGGGTDQLISMLTVFVGYMPLAYTMQQKGHVTMTVLTDRMKGRGKLVNEIWVGFYCTVFFVFMTYITGKAGFARAFASREIVEASFPFKLYLWYGKIGQPVGSAAIAVTSFFMFLKSLFELICYQKKPAGADAPKEGGE